VSLDTFENLKLEIIDWSHRDDVDLKIDTFIQLAESEMYANQIEPLKIRSEETLATASMDSTTPSRFVALPDGFQTMRKLAIQIVNGENIEIDYRTPSQLRVKSAAGFPCFFTVTSQLEFDRFPDIDYDLEIQYIKEFTPLSTAAPTNQVLTDHPTIYLFGALWALNNWAENEPDAARYFTQFINAIRGANKKADMGRYGPSPVMAVDGATP
jgi:hypothetical protein